MVLVIGEILFDLFPEYRRLGGAPFNFAAHLKNLSVPVRFFSRVGNDDFGKEILDYITSVGFSSQDIQVDDEHETGRVEVTLDQDGIPSFDIKRDAAYDYISSKKIYLTSDIDQADLIYFGTVVQRSEYGFNTMKDVLSQAGSGTVRFCDINLRPGCYTDAIIEESLKNADVLKINADELDEILELFGIAKGGEEALERLSREFGISTISVTNGPGESCIYTGNEIYKAKPEPVTDMVDTVGAGDAFASILALGVLHGWHPEATLKSAIALSSAICTIQGAIPKSNDLYLRATGGTGEKH